ncbi:MAG: 1-(5-phosphoribosyl)-5-[(5-phosphoribosylamino)methylideneamino]imidazole-4-carboxamide isomerase [Anaerolineae bacterium]
MILYPAIDLRHGRVVRLREGDPNQQTVFSDDPLATAQRWINQGAQWLHIVNLDGAFGQDSPNFQIALEISRLGVPVQFGGGIRTLEQIELALTGGIARVVLGTIAVQQPQIVIDAVQRYGPDAICVGLDARDGLITTHGWQVKSDLAPAELGREMARHGVRHVLFTDVSRDGKLQGVNVEATVELAQQTGLDVIASGGVNKLEDIRHLSASGVVGGVVIGMALYTGAFTLLEALQAVLPPVEGIQ